MTDLIDVRVPGLRTRLRVRSLSRWRSQTLGLVKPREIKRSTGVWLQSTRAVHTVGMRHAIDVIFLRADGVVAKVVPELKPWRLARCKEAHTALELRAGWASKLNLTPGVALELLA
jgi:uncharacterized membrane protein (UPF0127 family)